MQVIGLAYFERVRQMDRVLLTGVTGYIGQHCAAELLRQGYEVVDTARSRNKADATRIAVAKVAPIQHLSFVEADLLSDRGWAEAMYGRTYVLHVASPFMLAEPKHEDDMIAPTSEPISMATVANVLRNAGYTRAPSRRAPTAFDNQSTRSVLKWQPTPLETSFKDMAASISR